MDVLGLFALVRDVVVTASTAVVAVVAYRGLESWRREMKGKAAFETARGLARATYRLRDEIKFARRPFVSCSEFPDGYNQMRGSASPEDKAKGWAHVCDARWQPVGLAVVDFSTQALEAESLWGRDIRVKTDALYACAEELFSAMQAVVRDKQSGGEDFEHDSSYKDATMAAVYAYGNERDRLSQSIATAVNSIEEHLRPHLRRG